MNKSNYYYEKLIQSFIFSDNSWKDIIDFDKPYENIYQSDFLKILSHVVLKYQKKECLESSQINALQIFLSDLRFEFPYQSQTEKESYWNVINNLIRISNQIGDQHAVDFYQAEIEKRYGIYRDSDRELDLLIRDLLKNPREIKIDLANDIFSLGLFFEGIDQLPQDHIEFLTLNQDLFSTINAIMAENIKILLDPIIRNRFLYLLKKNQKIINSKSYVPIGTIFEERAFQVQNQLVLKKLESQGH